MKQYSYKISENYQQEYQIQEERKEEQKPKKNTQRNNQLYTNEQKIILQRLWITHQKEWKMKKYAKESGIREDYCRKLIMMMRNGNDITQKKRRGPQPKHSDELLQIIEERIVHEKKSTREISKELNISPTSVCRYMKIVTKNQQQFNSTKEEKRRNEDSPVNEHHTQEKKEEEKNQIIEILF